MSSPPSPKIDVDDHLQRLHDLYYEDKLVQCSQLLAELHDFRKTLSSTDAAAAALLQKKISTPLIKQVDDECAQLGTFQSALDHDIGWTLSYDGADTKVWYRREEDTNSHSIRIHGTIRAPLINIAALLYESDLYESLLWYVTNSTCLSVDHPSPLKRAVHVCTYVPWPMYDRDVALFAYAVDALDDTDGNVVLAVSRSLCETDPVSDAPPAPVSSMTGGARVVRAVVHDSGFELTPVRPGVTRARFLYNVDPMLRFLPIAVVNWAARTLCRWSLRVLEARARDLERVSPEYAVRMSEQPVYERMRVRLSQYWKQRGVDVNSPDCITDAGEDDGEPVRFSDDFDADEKQVVPTSIVTSLIAGDARKREVQKEDVSSSSSFTGLLRKRISAHFFGTGAADKADGSCAQAE